MKSFYKTIIVYILLCLNFTISESKINHKIKYNDFIKYYYHIPSYNIDISMKTNFYDYVILNSSILNLNLKNIENDYDINNTQIKYYKNKLDRL